MQKKEVLGRIDELLHSAKRVGGTDKNPVISTLAVFPATDLDDRHTDAIEDFEEDADVEEMPSGPLTIWHELGRGRKTRTILTEDSDNIVAALRFENHHRSRGFHLRQDVVLFDVNGEKIGKEQSAKVGLKPKGWGGYRHATRHLVFENAAPKAAYVLVISRRDPEGDFWKEVTEQITKTKRIIDQVRATIALLG